MIVFYGVNGDRLTFDNDAAYELVMAVATGALSDAEVVAQRLAAHGGPR